MIDCRKERLVGRDLYSKQISIFYLSFRSMGVFSTQQTLESPGRWSSRHVCGGHLNYVSWCRGIHSLAGHCRWSKLQKENPSMHSSLLCTAGYGCTVTNALRLLPLWLQCVHCDWLSPQLQVKINPFSLKLLLSVSVTTAAGVGGRQTTLKGYKYWSGKKHKGSLAMEGEERQVLTVMEEIGWESEGHCSQCLSRDVIEDRSFPEGSQKSF